MTFPWDPESNPAEQLRANGGEAAATSLLADYLTVQELARAGALDRGLEERTGSKLEPLDLMLASGVGLAGYIAQHLLQETFYEQLKAPKGSKEKGLSNWLETFTGTSHPNDMAMKSYPKGDRGFHRIVWHDAFSIAENPFIINIFGSDKIGVPGMQGSVPGIIAKTFVHLLADVLTKRGLPLPGLGNLPEALRVDIWKNHVKVWRDLCEFNVGDIAGLGLVKIASDGICHLRGHPAEAVSRHEFKFVAYSTYAIISALLANPNPLAFAMAAWCGVNTLQATWQVTSLLNERADLVLLAAERLSQKTAITERRAEWVESLYAGDGPLDTDARLAIQAVTRESVAHRLRPTWNL
jgi:hypothetical protein